jgi:hypothetical protein
VSHPASRGSPAASARPAKPPRRPTPPSQAREYRGEVSNEQTTEHKVSIRYTVAVHSHWNSVLNLQFSLVENK